MTTPPAIYGQFGQALAFAERTLTAILYEHLAQRGTKPEPGIALQLIATRGPGLSRQALSRDLEGSRNVAAASGARPGSSPSSKPGDSISGYAHLDLTTEGESPASQPARVRRRPDRPAARPVRHPRHRDDRPHRCRPSPGGPPKQASALR